MLPIAISFGFGYLYHRVFKLENTAINAMFLKFYKGETITEQDGKQLQKDHSWQALAGTALVSLFLAASGSSIFLVSTAFLAGLCAASIITHNNSLPEKAKDYVSKTATTVSNAAKSAVSNLLG